jgi:hypothetical protein
MISEQEIVSDPERRAVVLPIRLRHQEPRDRSGKLDSSPQERDLAAGSADIMPLADLWEEGTAIDLGSKPPRVVSCG